MRYIDETFENWGFILLANVTVRTFFPRNVRGIQAVVRLAARKVKHKKTCSAVFNYFCCYKGVRVRAAATRHTFNPWLWGVESELQPGTPGFNTEYVVAMLPLRYTVLLLLGCAALLRLQRDGPPGLRQGPRRLASRLPTSRD